MSDDPRDVFVSRSSTDATVAMTIVDRLEAIGLRCWIAPRDIDPGEVYADSLYHAINSTPLFLVLMSQAANDSKHVNRELTIADQMSKRIFPIGLEDFEPTGAFCYHLRVSQYYSWRADSDLALRRVAWKMNRCLGRPTSEFDE